jgi:urease accessory protein
MLRVDGIVGHADEPRFRGRRVERLSVAWSEASKRRLRRDTDAGTDVAIDVPRGTYLADAAVLFDDGECIVVVERRPEAALVVSFDPALPAAKLVEQAVRLGHAFGNQHVPLDVEGEEVRVPLTTSEDVARATLERLELDGVEMRVAPVALARVRPLPTGQAHEHRGASAHADPHASAHEGVGAERA